MTKNFVSAIETLGVGPQQLFHSLDQVRIGRFDHDVKVIGHKAIAVDLPRGLFAAFLQRPNKALTILVVAEDILAMITAAHDMINSSRILNA